MQLRWWLAVVLGIGGCATSRPQPAPVVDRTGSIATNTSNEREVRSGDTLFSIAWESGRDYRDVAAWNDISPPYTIRPGQKIRLSDPAASSPAKEPTNAPENVTPAAVPAQPAAESPPAKATAIVVKVHTVARGETLNRIARRHDLDVRKLAAWNNLSPPYVLTPGQRLRLGPVAPKTATNDKPSVVATSKPQTKIPPTTPKSDRGSSPTTKPPREDKPAANVAPVSRGQWAWPADGALLERYKPDAAMKGIDIGGKKGQAIHAAGDGQVVYQGSGLRGYGQLIILKHEADFLSAYAHCDRILVKEGETIKRGQKIAEMGTSGTDRVKLHFEIRHRGAPVDPILHLPKR